MLIQHRRGVRPLRRTINVLRNQLLGSNASHGLTALVDETVRQRKFSDCIALPPLAALTHMCPTCHAASVSNSATMLPPPPNRVVLAFRSLSTPLWGSGMWPPVPLLRGSLASLSAGLLPVLSPPFSQRRSSTLRRNYARIDKTRQFHLSGSSTAMVAPVVPPTETSGHTLSAAKRSISARNITWAPGGFGRIGECSSTPVFSRMIMS
jgi:hypothetical protein